MYFAHRNLTNENNFIHTYRSEPYTQVIAHMTYNMSYNFYFEHFSNSYYLKSMWINVKIHN